MVLFKKKKIEKTNNVVELKYKPITKTPDLAERQYEEISYRKYNITKKHKFSTK